MVQKADPILTPGTLVPGISVDLLRVPGYAKKARPGRWASARMKSATMKRYGLSRLLFRQYTFDHLIAIENGGAPADPLNHWPQPKAEAVLKDRQESALHRQIISGTLTIETAADMVRASWVG